MSTDAELERLLDLDADGARLFLRARQAISMSEALQAQLSVTAERSDILLERGRHRRAAAVAQRASP